MAGALVVHLALSDKVHIAHTFNEGKTDAGHLSSTLGSSWLKEEIRHMQSESSLHSTLTILAEISCRGPLGSAATLGWFLVCTEPPTLLRRNASHYRSK